MWLHDRAFPFRIQLMLAQGLYYGTAFGTWNPKQGGSAYKQNLVMQMPHQRRMQNHTAKERLSFSQRWP